MRMTSRCVTAAAVSCVLLAACQSGPVPNQVLTKPAPVSASPPAPRSNGAWINRPSTALQRFTLDQHAVVTIGLDTAARTDTLSSHVELSFTGAPAGRSVNGTVSAFLVGGAGRAAATPAGLVTPFPFRAAYSASGVQLGFTAPADVTPCSSAERAAAESLRDLWFDAPDTLRVGSTWSDSSSYVTCRDGIPLRSTVHRMFHVSGSTARDGRVLLSVARLSRTVIDGSGSQFGDSVTVSGSGNGQLAYDFDPANGEILSASGNATLNFSLRSSQRTQIVRQAVEIRIGRS
jgi:hypothetical protein